MPTQNDNEESPNFNFNPQISLEENNQGLMTEFDRIEYNPKTISGTSPQNKGKRTKFPKILIKQSNNYQLQKKSHQLLKFDFVEEKKQSLTDQQKEDLSKRESLSDQ